MRRAGLPALIALIAVIGSALVASALVSKDTPTRLLNGQDLYADTHQLYWRLVPADAWITVGSAQALALVTHPTEPVPFFGVDWRDALAGTLEDVGDFQATATRAGRESERSETITLDGGPPPAPSLLACLVVLAWLRRRQRLAGPS